jgi:PAS domain-containing protein
MTVPATVAWRPPAGQGPPIEDCGSVAETLARLNTRSYDLLILDFRLPDASGLAVMDWLLSNDRRESVTMISGEQSMEAASAPQPRRRRLPHQALQRRTDPPLVTAPRQASIRAHHRLSQQRLQSSEQMHRYMVGNSLDLIYTLDAEGRFNYLNLRIESLLGHPRNALIGKALLRDRPSRGSRTGPLRVQRAAHRSPRHDRSSSCVSPATLWR